MKALGDALHPQVIDFSVWVSEDPVVITSAAPQPVVRPLLLLQIFQTEVRQASRGTFKTDILYLFWILYTLYICLNVNEENTNCFPCVSNPDLVLKREFK